MSENKVIKYGISYDYVPDWGFTEAYREIIQNFKDYGDYIIKESNNYVYIRNHFKPENLNFLKVGCSSKRENSESIGKHGEGLKIALLVLKRLNIPCDITFDNNSIEPIVYSDEFLGDNCFGLSIQVVENINFNNFTLRFMKNEYFDQISPDFILKEEDIIYSDCYGDIVNKPKGNIYVGGLWVCKIDDLSYAYDIKPQHIDLGRDRSIPSTFDVEYYCSQINDGYLNSNVSLKFSDLNINNRDFSYVYKLPENIVNGVEPVPSGDSFIFKEKESGKVILSTNITKILFTSPSMKIQMEKIKEILPEKETPFVLLSKFENNYKSQLSNSALNELNSIVTQSIKWKVDNELSK